MESVIRNVSEMDDHDRQVLERVLGQSLRENQQLVIHIVESNVQQDAGEAAVPRQGTDTPVLPEWCRLYAGLSDIEIADIEQSILLRADLSRETE